MSMPQINHEYVFYVFDDHEEYSEDDPKFIFARREQYGFDPKEDEWTETPIYIRLPTDGAWWSSEVEYGIDGREPSETFFTSITRDVSVSEWDSMPVWEQWYRNTLCGQLNDSDVGDPPKEAVVMIRQMCPPLPPERELDEFGGEDNE